MYIEIYNHKDVTIITVNKIQYKKTKTIQDVPPSHSPAALRQRTRQQEISRRH